MVIQSEKTWRRHANPWSGFTRMITYPLLFIPIWFFQEFLEDPTHCWYPLIAMIAVIIWFAINPRIFPEPKNTDNWFSKGVLGEKLWVSDKRYKDIHLVFPFLETPFFFISLYTAYMKMFWPTLFFASVPWLLKVWFFDRMVFYYESNKDKIET